MSKRASRKLEKYVVRQITQHGKTVYYFRKGKGPRTRLPGVPGSEEFEKAYLAARAAVGVSGPRKHARQGSLKWLIDQHRQSAYWAGLSVATRRQRENIFRRSIERSGDVDFRAINRKSITAAINERAATPAQANTFLKAMRALFEWAVKNDYLEHDPTKGVEMLSYKTGGFTPWTEEDAEKFCAKWPIGTMERLAFELARMSGLRRSDLHRAGRQHLRGNIFQMKTQKTGALVTMEFPFALIDIINQTPSGGLHFISGKGGQPFSVESFGNWFRRAAKEAGVNKPLHGIRKLAATAAADAGATAHELMAAVGWAAPREAEPYPREADRARLGLALSRRLAERKKDK